MTHFSNSSSPERLVPMRVIVCGLHRTGTMSMRAALWQLGFYDCYHMHTLMQNLDQDTGQWIRALKAKRAGKEVSLSKNEWDRLLNRYQACCDLPSAIFSVELAKVYPEAKVIILNREPNAWYESVLNTVHSAVRLDSTSDLCIRLYCYAFDPQMRMWAKFANLLFSGDIGFNHAQEKQTAITWYNLQYDGFRKGISTERCLEYKVQDGWGPLCQHLGVDIPMIRDDDSGKLIKAPFPRLNDRDEFAIRRWEFEKQLVKRATMNILSITGRLALAGGLGYNILWTWRNLYRWTM